MKPARKALWAILIAALAFGAYQWHLQSKALAALPESIGVQAVKEIRLVPGFPQWLAFGSSGYFLYALDESTTQSLQLDGLSYLNAATPSTHSAANSNKQRHQYQPWSASPLPSQLTAFTVEGRGLWSGLVHAQFNPEFESQVLGAAKEPGSYYTANSHGDMLVVMPRLRVAIFSWVQ